MNCLSHVEVVEYKIHEIDQAVDDLTSLAHSPEGARAIAQSHLPTIVKRLNELRLDVQLPAAAE